MIDDTYENENWLTPTPDQLGIKSKAGLVIYLEKLGMLMEDFKKTPLYKMNKEEWDAMNV
jgi:hypothetical protein